MKRSLLVAAFTFALMGSGYIAGFTAAGLQSRADALEQATLQAAADRQEENRQAKAVTEISNDTDTELQNARAAAAAADSTADRLRKELAASERRYKSQLAAEHEVRTQTGLLYAELFRRADERAGDLAKYADQQTVKLNACVRAYESVTGTTLEGNP